MYMIRVYIHKVRIHLFTNERMRVIMLYESKQMEEKGALQVAAMMCVAARTAPKGHGIDTIHTFVLTGEEKERLAAKM